MYLNEAARCQLHEEYVLYQSTILPYQDKDVIKKVFQDLEKVLVDEEEKVKEQEKTSFLNTGVSGFKHKTLKKQKKKK